MHTEQSHACPTQRSSCIKDGKFADLWTECNDKYRGTVRDHWRGQATGVKDLAFRLSGSSDLYADEGRRPYASINFVTAHDGFTLRDLVSYNEKHNEANLDDNRDGENHNRSWNCGAKGSNEDQGIRALRLRPKRNLIPPLFLSQGAPTPPPSDKIRPHKPTTQHN